MRRCASFRSWSRSPNSRVPVGQVVVQDGLQADGLPVGAEVHLRIRGTAELPLELGNLEGTGHHAVAAADALVVVIDHRPLWQFGQGPHRAGAGAGRVQDNACSAGR